MRERFLAVHPYASLYAGFGDFHLWRIRPMGALFVGGFARAVRLRQAELAPDADSVAALTEAEAGIISHCNNDHADALAAIAREAGAWRMVTADVDGMDLALGERVVRFPWSAPVANAGGVRTQLVQMTRAARQAGA
jgi:putative heme iron utilization protein